MATVQASFEKAFPVDVTGDLIRIQAEASQQDQDGEGTLMKVAGLEAALAIEAEAREAIHP